LGRVGKAGFRLVRGLCGRGQGQVGLWRGVGGVQAWCGRGAACTGQLGLRSGEGEVSRDLCVEGIFRHIVMDFPAAWLSW
jgi:hypothetical protein